MKKPLFNYLFEAIKNMAENWKTTLVGLTMAVFLYLTIKGKVTPEQFGYVIAALSAAGFLSTKDSSQK